MTLINHRRSRLTAALVVLWSAISLQLMALPPEVFSLGGGVCVMECSLEGRKCCCTGLVEPHHGHDVGDPIWAQPKLASGGRKCPPLNTAKEETRVQGKGRLAEVGSTSATVAAAGSLAHSDLQLPKTAGLELAALPRPPPHHLLFA